MGLFDKQREMFAAARQHVAGLCPPDDPLVGAFVGAHAKTFSNQLYTVGATRNFLVLQAINKKFLPDGNPIWLRPSDITNAALWGSGGGFREWFAENSEYELRFQTTGGEHYKIIAMGGWTMAKAMGDGYLEGMEVVAEWLARAWPSTG